MSKVIEKHLSSWREFAATIDEIEEFAANERKKQSMEFTFPLFYRGLGDARWGLETSLERNGASLISMGDYWIRAWFARPRIEAFTDRAWTIVAPGDYSMKLAKDLFPQPSTEMEYLCYLRHHGFPSPLLDWTLSPYVAAFFAFEQPPAGSERIVIYVYSYSMGGNHAGADALPEIYLVPPSIRTHRRHFMQQSRYTFCVVRSGITWNYAKHDHVFFVNSNYELLDVPNQDWLWRITIPTSERLTALRALKANNITKYSLVGSEESLLSTAALELFELNRPN